MKISARYWPIFLGVALFSAPSILAEEKVLSFKKSVSAPCLWDQGMFIGVVGDRISPPAYFGADGGLDELFFFPKTLKLGDSLITNDFRKAGKTIRLSLNKKMAKPGKNKIPYTLGEESDEYEVMVERNSVGHYRLKSCVSFEGKIGDIDVEVIDSNGDGRTFVELETVGYPVQIQHQEQEKQEKRYHFRINDFIRFGKNGTWMPMSGKYWVDGHMITFIPVDPKEKIEIPVTEEGETEELTPINSSNVKYTVDASVPCVTVAVKIPKEIVRGDWVIRHKTLDFVSFISNRSKLYKLPPGEYEILMANVVIGKGNLQTTWRNSPISRIKGEFEITEKKRQSLEFGIYLRVSKNLQANGTKHVFRVEGIIGCHGEPLNQIEGEQNLNLKDFDVFLSLDKRRMSKAETTNYG